MSRWIIAAVAGLVLWGPAYAQQRDFDDPVRVARRATLLEQEKAKRAEQLDYLRARAEEQRRLCEATEDRELVMWLLKPPPIDQAAATAYYRDVVFIQDHPQCAIVGFKP